MGVYINIKEFMSINGISGNYYNVFDVGSIQKSITPFSVPLNSVFDEVIFSTKNAENTDETQETDADRIKIIAHRGYTEIAPENTIPAFIAAAENGYTTIECDVEWTKDGVPVILHDSTINRTARYENGNKPFWPKKCSNLTYEELLEYDFGSWYSDDFKGTKIPAFNEVLDCANDYDLNLYVELKETADFNNEKAQTLADAVREAGLEDKVTWISFNADYLKTMSEIMPNSRLGYLTKKSVSKNTVETLQNLQTGENEVFLDIKSAKISEKLSKMLQEAGFDFEVWTVDNSNEIEKLASYDCKGITTDKITEDDIADYYNN